MKPLKRCWQSRMGWAAVQVFHVFILFTVLRVVLLARYWPSLPHSARSLLWALWIGARMDVGMSLAMAVPTALALAALPESLCRRRWFGFLLSGLYMFTLFWLGFFNVIDLFFFDEFNSRLNYVAVDYLLTPGEVIGNIWQSYPVPLVVSIVGALTLLLFWPFRRFLIEKVAEPVSLKLRMGFALTLAALSAVSLSLVDIRLLNSGPNRILNEIGANGFYTFFYALFTNHMDYNSQYLTVDPALATRRLKQRVIRPDEKEADSPNPLERIVPPKKGLGDMNVVIILEESLGAKFVGALGAETKNLTPNLDRWSERALFFTRFYATGTRTVRALEAVLASFPPIPGSSIVKRDKSDNLATVAREFKRRGYDTLFIYGGRGVFDGMRHFTTSNGFDRFVEQKDYPKPTFTTIWGVCDEDIFHKALEEFDGLYGARKKFFSTVLTVSNHKPYTYPKGRIDLDPDQHSRDHAVKYADYALGQFLDQASTHPFFKDTVFVIMGDHGARIYGADFIPIDSYEIPLLILSPDRLPPRKIDTLGCSMDVAPTLLGLLGASYPSVFFGKDLFEVPKNHGYVLLQHDREVGFFDGGFLSVLSTRQFSGIYKYDPAKKRFAHIENPDEKQKELAIDAAAFYQTGYNLYAAGEFRLHQK